MAYELSDEQKMNLAQKRLERMKKNLAESICSLSDCRDEMKWSCDDLNWNDEVLYDLDGALKTLGMCLAVFQLWNEDETNGGLE